ncbi:MAG: hypothetical protein IKZ44_10880 [Clostridia bacterium]|nr:hypothetical protein [Clostridia bacterium]
MEPKTLLVTGFMPFGGEAKNPSWEAMRILTGPAAVYRPADDPSDAVVCAFSELVRLF